MAGFSHLEVELQLTRPHIQFSCAKEGMGFDLAAAAPWFPSRYKCLNRNHATFFLRSAAAPVGKLGVRLGFLATENEPRTVDSIIVAARMGARLEEPNPATVRDRLRMAILLALLSPEIAS
jgi:hypothetical protein